MAMSTSLGVSPGSGLMIVQVKDHIKISISGDVYYVGSPTVEQSAAGSGNVVQIGGEE